MKAPVPIIRALQELSCGDKFEIFAIDHRDVFVDMLKEAGKYLGESSVTKAKLDIIKNVEGLVSGYLIDPFYALPAAIIDESIPGSVGFMVHIENNDYRVESIGSNYCIQNLTPNTIKRMGASAVKLFLYYNPDSKYSVESEKQIRAVAEACHKNGIPFLLEPVLYPLPGQSMDPQKKTKLLMQTIKRFAAIPITIYKINFPGDLDYYSDVENIQICRRVTDMLDVPWVIMSSDVPDAVFERQLELSCKGGASGYVAGRSVWKPYLYSNETEKDLERHKMRERLRRINAIVDKYAAAWTEKIEAERQPASEWYVSI